MFYNKITNNLFMNVVKRNKFKRKVGAMEQTIYFAGGCFWGVQGYFDLLHGVKATRVGYANASVSMPSYELVCSGMTHAVEAIEVCYDDSIIPLGCGIEKEKMPDCLLARFFSIIDPCALNFQGNDKGTQYRSGIYIPQHNASTQDNRYDIGCIKAFIARYIAPCYTLPIVTEVMALQNFYEAEEYHQKYLQKNPNGYCHIDIQKALQPLCDSLDSCYLKP